MGLTERRTVLLLTAGLALLAGALFWPAVGHEFLNLDDDRYVAHNPRLADELSPDGLKWALTTGELAVWIPATRISFLADRQFFGPGPAGFHRTNVLLHVANVLLLFFLLKTWTGMVWRSALVAALFAVHPLNVEPVAWVTARKDVLFLCFGLASLHLWLRWLRRPAAWSYCATLLLLVLALTAKPAAVVVPAVMALMVGWPQRRHAVSYRKIALAMIPFAAVAVAVILVTRISSFQAATDLPLATPFLERLGRAGVMAVTYLGRIFRPVDLCIHYPVESLRWNWGVQLGAAALLGGITFVLARLRRRAGWAITGWLWFLVTVLPALDLVQGGQQLMSDRYLYLPTVGIFLMVAFGLARIVEVRPALRRLAVGAAVVAVALTTWLSAHQLATWRDNETVFDHALAVTQDNHQAHLSLATHFGATGESDRALSHARRAVAIKPSALGYYNLGNILTRLDRPGPARRAFADAVRLRPDLAVAHNNLGLLAGNDGRPVAAEKHFRDALAADPEQFVARLNLARLLAALGRSTEARSELLRILERDPNHAEARALSDRLPADH